MLGAKASASPVATVAVLADQPNTRLLISNSHYYSTIRCSFQLSLGIRHCRYPKSVIISCKASDRNFAHRSNNSEERDDDYVEAIVLISETVKHYRMHMNGFQEGIKWQSSAQTISFSLQGKDPRADVNNIGTGFLRRYKSPTIFLKISCDGDFVLPIIVGEHAVEKLIDSLHEDESGGCPSQFQLTRNMLQTLGYEVKMVRIVKRVINTYFARIFFQKPGEKNIFSVDARPSDAINIARQCKAPIFVNKQIVLTDAVRLVYGMSRTSNAKSVYDVSLDSPSDDPDLLSEELMLVRNMSLAIQEERYKDAAMWRDKLKKLLDSTHDR